MLMHIIPEWDMLDRILQACRTKSSSGANSRHPHCSSSFATLQSLQQRCHYTDLQDQEERERAEREHAEQKAKERQAAEQAALRVRPCAEVPF